MRPVKTSVWKCVDLNQDIVVDLSNKVLANVEMFLTLELEERTESGDQKCGVPMSRIQKPSENAT